MAAPNSAIYHPATLLELLELRARHPEASIWAGGTEILMYESGRFIPLPETILSLSQIPELKAVTRSERFFEAGACITLQELGDLGAKLLPSVLTGIIPGIATYSVRNLATLGGNIASKKRRMDTFAVLACLDAQAELKRLQGSRWIGVAHLFDFEGTCILKSDEVITRIRIPFESWNIGFVKKCGSIRRPDGATSVFCFLAKTSREVITDVRIAMAGNFYVRDREIESLIIGRKLPLSTKEHDSFIARWNERLLADTHIDQFQARRFEQLLIQTLDNITELR